GTGTYTFNIPPRGNHHPPSQPPGPPYPLGTPVTDSLAAVGEQDRYSFALSTASLLYFDALTNNANLTWTLTGPAGTAVNSRSFTQSDSGNIANPVLNLVAGNYTLTVQGTGGFTGAYSFRLSDLRQASALTPGSAVVGDLAPANETDLYRFDSAAGQSVFFDVHARSGAPNARYRLIDPYGAVLVTNVFDSSAGNRLSGRDVSPLALSTAGTYTLLLEGN